MILPGREPGSDPAHPDHAIWHTRHTLPDPDGLLAIFWTRLEVLSAADAAQILLATREIERDRLIPARRAALGQIEPGSLDLEMDEWRLHEVIEAFIAREPAAIPDEAARKLLYGALRDTILALAAAQTEATLRKADYDLLTAAWWAGAG